MPGRLVVLLLIAVAAQVLWAATRGAPAATRTALPAPPPVAVLRVFALGEPAVLGRGLMLWLQSHDYQPGLSIPLRELDYRAIEAWLGTLLELDPEFQYPLLIAARLYGEVNDRERQRQMIEFIARAYRVDPARRWPWLTHAVFLARHRLHDLPYALALAHELNRSDDHGAIPHWAKQMEIFVLDDMGEVEAAKVLLGGLLASGEIADAHERAFLAQRLAQLERQAAESAR